MSDLSIPLRIIAILRYLFGFHNIAPYLAPPPAVTKAINSQYEKALETKGRVDYAPPASYLVPKCHPLEPQTTAEVDGYFIKNWPFENEKAITKFINAGFSRVTCCYYPEALNDRIHFACRLLTLLFLIDGKLPFLVLAAKPHSEREGLILIPDLLEEMSLEDGKAYNDKLMPISRGDVLPDRRIPVEWITYDLWESMRAFDRKLADEILEPVFTFMRAQTDPRRKNQMELGEYLEYRERDVGKA